MSLSRDQLATLSTISSINRNDAMQQQIVDILLDDYPALSMSKRNKNDQTPIIAACSNYEIADGSNFVMACKLACKLNDVLRT